MERPSRLSSVLLAFAALCVALLVALPLFWASGGITWLDTKVFPPRRPKGMAPNSVWIDAPPAPISWHHGWWFGCELAQSGTANYCRFVKANGEQVYAGEYLPCATKIPLPISTQELVPPPRNEAIWIGDERLKGLVPVGVLRNGDLLLPVVVLNRCDTFKQSGH